MCGGEAIGQLSGEEAIGFGVGGGVHVATEDGDVGGVFLIHVGDEGEESLGLLSVEVGATPRGEVSGEEVDPTDGVVDASHDDVTTAGEGEVVHGVSGLSAEVASVGVEDGLGGEDAYAEEEEGRGA